MFKMRRKRYSIIIFEFRFKFEFATKFFDKVGKNHYLRMYGNSYDSKYLILLNRYNISFGYSMSFY